MNIEILKMILGIGGTIIGAILSAIIALVVYIWVKQDKRINVFEKRVKDKFKNFGTIIDAKINKTDETIKEYILLNDNRCLKKHEKVDDKLDKILSDIGEIKGILKTMNGEH